MSRNPVLENDFLRIELDLDMGGRVISFYDKKREFEQLWYDAARVKPRDRARCVVISRYDPARILIGVFHAGDEDMRAHFRTADEGIVMGENALYWAEWDGIG